QKTGAGMMDCKKALTEANGDIEKAIELLRKKGAAVATKRAEKTANEGLVLSKVIEDGKTGVIVEVSCETDFVAKSEDFIKFANDVLNAVIETRPSSVQELFEKNPDLKNKHTDLLGKIGEKIEVSRFSIDKLDDGIAVDYIHPGSKLGVLVSFEKAQSAKDDFPSIGKDIAMQVAAMKPICTYREEVPKDIIDKEMEIYKELARKEGKPENILDKIATGRLNKFYQENCLVEQAYIKDNSKTIADLIKEYNSKNGTEIKIKGFKRYHLGDEKK
ncbi:MAG: translation elongation factor Ts, partial [Ignavibacteria bacterium]|nr:translation elongation factor Ts [Ignavibacteria bacterium]